MKDEKTRVLVVDDDPLSVELILEQLKGPSYELITAGDGQAAWSLLEKMPEGFDVVLLDRMMPGLSGMEVLARIKRHPKLANLPVIMQTALSDRADIIEGISAGAYYYITKPLDSEMLESMVQAAASDHERYRELQVEVKKQAGMLSLMRSALFEFRTPDEATDLGTFLAKACPEPERAVLGLNELMVNAIEHGNLEITYEEKSELQRLGNWRAEIRHRLESAEFSSRVASVRFERGGNSITVCIRDQGPGFDPAPYLQIDPNRVFDVHGRGIAIANLLSFDSLTYRQNGREAVATIQCGQGTV